jgi:hypothetical protein
MIKDSGARHEFSTGAVRDVQDDKGLCRLLPLDVVYEFYKQFDKNHVAFWHINEFMETGDINCLYNVLIAQDVFSSDETMFLEVSKHFAEGCKKYGENNWKKGIPARYYVDSALRHYFKFLRGDDDEPHNRAFIWNILAAIWTCKHKPELNDYSREVEGNE